MAFKFTWREHIMCFLLAYGIVLILNSPVNSILGSFFERQIIFYPTEYLILNFYIYVFIMMIPITIIHELLHGVIYKLFGGKIKFGFKGIYAYTQEISGKPIESPKFAAVLLTPLLVISVISLFLPPWIGGMVFLLNLLGSSGDIFMTILLCRFTWNVYVVDRSYGFDIIYK